MSPDKSPDLKLLPSAEAESPAEVKKAIRDRYESTVVDSNTVFELPEGSMSDCGNRSEGVYQDLMAVIKAGDDYFALIDVFAINKSGSGPETITETVIARHRPGQRAELVGVVGQNKEPIVIGRSHQTDMGLGSTVSREHFGVAQDETGKIGILDLGSTNRTEVFKSKKDTEPQYETEDPLSDIDFWSVKSADLRTGLEDYIA